MTTLLLTGATGFLGSWIVAALGRGGVAERLRIGTLRVLARSPERAAGVRFDAGRLEVRRGDLEATVAQCVEWYRAARPQAR